MMENVLCNAKAFGQKTWKCDPLASLVPFLLIMEQKLHQLDNVEIIWALTGVRSVLGIECSQICAGQ